MIATVVAQTKPTNDIAIVAQSSQIFLYNLIQKMSIPYVFNIFQTKK